MELIKEVRLIDEKSEHIAAVKTLSDKILKITWRGIKKYWHYATYDDVEFKSYSFTGKYLILTMTVASGQGGIIGVWDCNTRHWVHIQNGDYAYCALLLEEYDILVSLHYVHNYVTPGHHIICANKFEPTGGWFDEDSICDIDVNWEKKSFRPENCYISQKAELNINENWLKCCGPAGLFYSSETKTIYAHDACNFASANITDILRKISLKHTEVSI